MKPRRTLTQRPRSGMARRGPSPVPAIRRTLTPPKPRAISAASPAQRAKVKDEISIVSGQPGCDPAHLVDRSLGGCDDPLCVVPLTRQEHRDFEAGELDLTPYLVTHNLIPEMQHALEHLKSPLRLIHKLTGVRHVPERKAA